MSVRAFAIREGLSVGSLSAWKRRLHAESHPVTAFAPVVVQETAAKATAGFELVLRDGVALRIPPDFDEATLARLVRALGAGR